MLCTHTTHHTPTHSSITGNMHSKHQKSTHHCPRHTSYPTSPLTLISHNTHPKPIQPPRTQYIIFPLAHTTGNPNIYTHTHMIENTQPHCTEKPHSPAQTNHKTYHPHNTHKTATNHHVLAQNTTNNLQAERTHHAQLLNQVLQCHATERSEKGSGTEAYDLLPLGWLFSWVLV